MSKHTPGPWFQDKYGNVMTQSGATLVTDGVAFGLRSTDETRANARLIAAAPDLLEVQLMGSSMNTPDFLDWIAERLVQHYHENPNVDFVLSLRARAASGRAAIAKAEGTV
jgi:hypothetical protein